MVARRVPVAAAKAVTLTHYRRFERDGFSRAHDKRFSLPHRGGFRLRRGCRWLRVVESIDRRAIPAGHQVPVDVVIGTRATRNCTTHASYSLRRTRIFPPIRYDGNGRSRLCGNRVGSAHSARHTSPRLQRQVRVRSVPRLRRLRARVYRSSDSPRGRTPRRWSRSRVLSLA